ncbi:hypothetical protein D3C72_1081360 [compost metagenome]
MKKLALALATPLLLMGLAGPAAAFVVDKQDLVSATDESKLEQALEKLGQHRFEVVFVDSTPGAPSATAKKVFKEQGLGEKDGVIVVAIEAKKVGVHVGEGFTRRGVSDDVVSQHIKSDFLPYAKKGQFARGAATLAKGLVDAGAAGSPGRGSNNRSSDGEGGGAGLLWGLLIVVGLGGGGIYYMIRKSAADSRAKLQERLSALKGPQERFVSSSIKLAEIDQLAQFHEGEAKAAFLKLAKGSNKTLQQARAFAEQYDTAQELLTAKRDQEAERHITELERSAVLLEAEVAAAMTALTNLDDGDITAEDLKGVDLPERVRKASSKLNDKRNQFENLKKRADKIGYSLDSRPETLLTEALTALTTQPVDLDGALESLTEADAAMKAMVRPLEDAEETYRIEEARRAEEARLAAEEAARTAAIVAATSSHHHHHDSGSSWSSSSSSDDSWGSSSDSSWGSDSGSSSDDNW